MKKSSSPRLDSEGDLSPEKTRGKQPKARLSVRELGSSTWPDFERVVEKHNGVWGGCWCTAFHLKRSEEKEWAGKRRALKEKLVRADRSHAALVYNESDVVGWNSLNVHRVRIPSARCSRSKQMDHAKSGSKSMKPSQRSSFQTGGESAKFSV